MTVVIDGTGIGRITLTVDGYVFWDLLPEFALGQIELEIILRQIKELNKHLNTDHPPK